MIERLAGIALSILLCSAASAQSSLDDRVRDLERRVEQLEKHFTQPASPANVSKPTTIQRDGWRQRDNWRSLKRGMTPSDVRSFLGEPTSVNAFASFTIWQYPGGGRAQFGSDEKLDGWSEPR
jgi:outer membrane protein assembly factor BamE (lipoprotein component of BamABCDE complex)